MKKILKYIAAPVVCAVVGLLLLVAVSFIPQSAIQKNAEISAQQLSADSIYPKYINIWDVSYRFDNHTDTLIMMGGYNLDDVSDALINPWRGVQEDGSYVTDSFGQVVTENAENDRVYVRYWQGFRIFIRPLLLIFPYFEIRQLVSWLFFALLFAVVAVMAKRKGVAAALCVGLAVMLVNPSIISHSLQFAPCFILSFCYILFLLLTEQWDYSRPLAFCVFGILTQFFDFYTVPMLTCGLPLVAMLVLDEELSGSIAKIIKSLLAWAYGWTSFWLIKLVMVDIFTDQPGLADGIGAFLGRIGAGETAAATEVSYSAVQALMAVWDMVTPGATGAVSLVLVALLVAASGFMILKNYGARELITSCSLLVVAALPIVWHIFTAQPTVIHAFYQYRDIAVFFAGVFLFAHRAVFGKTYY